MYTQNKMQQKETISAIIWYSVMANFSELIGLTIDLCAMAD